MSVATATTIPSTEFPPLNANAIVLPVGNSGKTISLMDLAYISTKDFEKLTERKMKLWDKVGFKIAQQKLRNKLNDDGTIKKDVAKQLTKKANKMAEGESGFHFGGFALGFFLGIIGVLIAYLINDDKKSNRVKWAWIAFGIGVVIALLTLLL